MITEPRTIKGKPPQGPGETGTPPRPPRDTGASPKGPR